MQATLQRAVGRLDGAAVSRQELIAEVRTWLGTPFEHQHARKGVACDCGGLIVGVLLIKGLIQADFHRHLPEAARAFTAEPDVALLRAVFEQHFEPVEISSMRPGDMAVFSIFGRAKHVGFVADYLHGGLSMIHAQGPGGPHRVVEHHIDQTWMRRIVAVYRMPGVA